MGGVIDGGQTDDDGDQVVRHVLEYTAKKWIDDLICTHPDWDHIGGLNRVVQRLYVARAWVHDPGRHIDLNMLKSTLAWKSHYKAAQKIYKSMTQSSAFLDLLDQKGILRQEPFAGSQAGMIQILGPTEWYYTELLRQFDDLARVFIEDDRPEAIKADRDTIDPDSVINEDNTTSAENNSSVICRIIHGGDEFLFTGDAGVPALEYAIGFGGVGNVLWLDVPHHGSKHNVCSSILDRLMPKIAYISARGTRKHPSQAVINALKRRGARCYGTFKTGTISHGEGCTSRTGWSSAEPL